MRVAVASYAAALSKLPQTRRHAPTGAVFIALATLAWWGHATEWKLIRAETSGAIEKPSARANAPHPTDESPASEKTKVLPTESAFAPATNAPGVGQPLVLFRSPAAVEKSGIRVAAAGTQSMGVEIVGNGMVAYDPTLVAQISSRVPGTVWRVEKQVGQPVHKGEVLAIIEAADVGEAKADFLSALVTSRLKDKTMLRLKNLGNVLATREVQAAEAAQSEARIRLANAQQKLVNLGLVIELADVVALNENELVRRIQFLGLPDAIVQGLDRKTTTTNLLPLTAPFDGVVIGREATVGEAVSIGQAQFVVTDNSRVWIYLDVSKEECSRLAIGQEFTFACDGVAGEVHGQLSWISTEVDSKTRMVRAKGEVQNPVVRGDPADLSAQRLLRAQTFGTGRIRVRDHSQVTTVPRSAVQWDDSRNLVFVRRGPTEFEPRAIRTGAISDDVVEVQSGVEPGEAVVTEGSHVLKSEMKRMRMAAH